MTEVKKDQEKVLMPCKRGSDPITGGQHCNNKWAYMLLAKQSKSPAFKCCECGYEWIVPLGGQFMGA